MIHIYLFRHGETDWNVQERFQGHTDIPLNETGRKQARDLIPVLQGHEIEAILTSDLSRAQETGQIVADALDLPIFQDPGLREAHLGKAQGLTRVEIESQFGLHLASRWRSSKVSDADISYPGGETGSQIMERVFSSLQRFLNGHSYTRFGVATHGGVIRRIMQKLLPPGSPPVPIPNGVVYEIQFLRESGFRVSI